jgi:hypothetical protein
VGVLNFRDNLLPVSFLEYKADSAITKAHWLAKRTKWPDEEYLGGRAYI